MSQKAKSPKVRRASNSPEIPDSENPIFNKNITNEQALRAKGPRRNNFLRASINKSGQGILDSKGSASSKGFSEVRKQLKRGNKEAKSKPRGINDLELNTHMLKTQYSSNSKRKLPKRKFSKSPAVIRFDGESPYAEYLPDLYREYKPKEKKLKRQNSNVSLNSFMKKIDKAYSDAQSVASRSGSRDGHFGLKRKRTNTKSLLKMGTLRSNSSKGGNSVRSNPAMLRRRKKSVTSVEDSFMKMAQMVKQKVINDKK